MSTSFLFFACVFGFFALVALGVIIPTVRFEKQRTAKIKNDFIRNLYFPNR
jgi:uncharacterized membrane protein